jgi:[ribosomal protein S18]-alanine N-acetyltransferase
MSRIVPATATVRPLDPFEIAIAAALHAASFEQPWNETSIAGLLAMPGSFGLLAVAAAQPVGLAIALATGAEAEILTLGVLPRFRRHGIGRSLLAAVTDRLARAGGARLLLEVAADNVAAQALYRDAGFLEVGRRPGYYQRVSGPAVDALLLACIVGARGSDGASAGCG